MTRATNSLIGRRSARPPAVLMNGATRFRPHPYCGAWSVCGGEFGFVPARHRVLMATGCHRCCHPERTLPFCHPERSRGIWLRMGGVPRPQADISATLRSARHDKRNELTHREALGKASGGPHERCHQIPAAPVLRGAIDVWGLCLPFATASSVTISKPHSGMSLRVGQPLRSRCEKETQNTFWVPRPSGAPLLSLPKD